MSERYQAVQWNRAKRSYDGWIAFGVLACIAAFAGVGATLFPSVTAETLIIRSAGVVAFLMLHVILSIGPLARLDHRFLPLLYNRRHLGVAMFLIALIHGAFSILQMHGFGDLNPLVSLLVSNSQFGSVSQFPFQLLGLGALIILFLMAATSHDFWLANLTPPVWKTLHMSVYVAYALLIGHIATGVLQSETHPIYPLILAAGILSIGTLHFVAGRKESRADSQMTSAIRRQPIPGETEDTAAPGPNFVEVAGVDEIPEKRALIVSLSGERVAIFRYDGKISAISNVCAHQNGPLGEGKIIDGCVTCPWHGYQYDPATGRAPAPFTESVPTFDVRVIGSRIWVAEEPNPSGTAVEPGLIDGENAR